MSRLLKSVGSISLLVFMAACTQPAARVELRGQNNYARDGGSSSSNYNKRNYSSSAPSGYQPYQPAPVYTNTKPVSMHTEQSAGTSSIGVSDLAPPPKSSNSSPQSANEPKPVNLWTHKERGREEVKAPQESAPVAKLEAPKAEPVQLAKNSKEKSGGFMWPVSSHKVFSSFGPKGGGKANDGINIASASGEPVWATADGEVVYVGDELKGYGNMILIKHSNNKTSSYAHLNRATVDKYDRVHQGDIIGYVGTTGNVKKPQLHFAMRDGQSPIDPKKYLSTSVAGL